jgi:hypothetical protein
MHFIPSTIVLSLYITIYVLASYMAQKGPSKKQRLSSSTAIDHSIPFLPTQADVESSFMVLCVLSFSTRPIPLRLKAAAFVYPTRLQISTPTMLDAKWHLPILTYSFILTSVKPGSLMGELSIFLYNSLSSVGKVCLALRDSVTNSMATSDLIPEKYLFNPKLEALESATAKVK